MYPVRPAVATFCLALSLLAVASCAAAEGEPPLAPPGDLATPSPLPPGLPPAQPNTELPIPEPPGAERIPPPAPPGLEPRSLPMETPPPPAPPLYENRTAVPPPVMEYRPNPAPAPATFEAPPKQPSLPPAFRVLTSEDAAPPAAVRPGPAVAPPPVPVPAAPPVLVPPAPPEPPAMTQPVSGPSIVAPYLVVEKHGPATARVGQPLVYDLVVRNTGSGPAAQLHLQDEIPPGARLLGTTPAAVVQGTHLVWLIESLPRNAEARFRVELQPQTAGEIATRASLIAFSGEVRTAVLGSGLALTVTAPETAPLGQNVVLKIQIVNSHPQPLRKMLLVSRLAEGLLHPAGREIEADLGDLEPGQSKTVDLKVVASRPGRLLSEMLLTAEGGHQATAQAAVLVQGPSSDGPAPAPVPFLGSGPAPVPPPVAPPSGQGDGSLVVRKKGLQRLQQGQQAEYQLEVLNKADNDAVNVLLQDKLPVGLDFVGGSKGVTYDPANRTIVWAPGLLGARQSATAWIKLMPKQTGELVNLVTVQGDNRPEARLIASLTISGRSSPAFTIPGLGKQR